MKKALLILVAGLMSLTAGAVPVKPGLLLTRYAFDENVWMDDAPNNIQTMKRGLLITADNAKLNYSASSTNLFGNGVNEITGQTFRSGTELNVTITNIQKNADGSITFDYDPTATAIRGIETSANAENEKEIETVKINKTNNRCI